MLRFAPIATMIEGVRYVHTNLIARDWRALAQFYELVFGCEVVPPIRDFPAHAVDAGAGIPGASLTGVHLRHGRPGFGHIAFAVRSVTEARTDVLAAGGKPVGDVVTITTATGTQITWCYVTDPEGNIIELQASLGKPS